MRAGSFRPCIFEVDVRLGQMSVLLCNDKVNSHGAPDVLQASLEQLRMQFATVQRSSKVCPHRLVLIFRAYPPKPMLNLRPVYHF